MRDIPTIIQTFRPALLPTPSQEPNPIFKCADLRDNLVLQNRSLRVSHGVKVRLQLTSARVEIILFRLGEGGRVRGVTDENMHVCIISIVVYLPLSPPRPSSTSTHQSTGVHAYRAVRLGQQVLRRQVERGSNVSQVQWGPGSAIKDKI